MTDIVDDLLQEVEELESSTQQLNETVQKVDEKKETLNDVPSSVDANLLALETAKTSQEAASQSHNAAKSTIKLADQLKARNLELDDLSSSWRQATRTTLKDVGTAKNHFTLMMATTLVINIVALGVIGYLSYANSQKNSQATEEILDVIQTENMLLGKKVTKKMDELSGLTEALGANVQHLSQSKASQPMATAELHKDASGHNKESNQAFTELQTQYSELKTLLENLATSQKTTPDAATTVVGTQQEAELDKKLKGLRWLVRTQGETLKQIQKSLSTSPTTQSSNKSLDAITMELRVLTKQQTAIKMQIEKLQADFSKFAKPKPYSFNSARCGGASSCE